MQELEPLVKVRFSFGEHGPQAIRFLPKVMDEAEILFTSTQGSHNIYLMEMAGASETFVLRFKNLARRTGSYLEAFIQVLSPMTFGCRLDPTELERLRDSMLSDIPEEIISRDPTDTGIFGLREVVELQKLRQRVNFEFDLESYPEKEAKRLAKLDRISKELAEQAFNEALQGSVDQSVRSLRKSILISGQSDRARNLDFVRRIAEYSREAHRQHRPTRVFIRIGEAHDVLLDRLTNHWEEGLRNPEISYYYDWGEPTIRKTISTTLIADLEVNPLTTIPKEKILSSMLEEFIVFQQISIGKTRQGAIQVAKRVLSGTTSSEIEELIRTLPHRGFERAVGQLVYSKFY